MRIIVVNVNTSQTMTSVIEESARRYASAGTQIAAVQPYFGAEAVDCNFESYLSAVAVMDRVIGYDEPYDAVVLAGFGEHGRDGIAELIEQPVVEICEASAHVAMMIGRAYSVVTTLQRSVAAIEDRLRLAGLRDRCASVRASGMSTLEVDSDPAAAIRAIVAQAREAVETDHAEVICLGCAGMAGLEEAITAELRCPRGRRSRRGRPAGRGDRRPRPEDEQALDLRAAGAQEDHRLAAFTGARPATTIWRTGMSAAADRAADLASRWLGGSVVAASDESFGDKENLLAPAARRLRARAIRQPR